MQRTQRFGSGLVLLLAAAVLQGCAVVRDDLLFKSEARAALGKDVADSWSKVEPTKAVEVARANYTAIHDRRLADVDLYQANLQTLLQAYLAVGYSTPLMKQMSSLQNHAGAAGFQNYCFRAPTISDPYCSFWNPNELVGSKEVAQAFAAKRPTMEIRAIDAKVPARFALRFQRAQRAIADAEVAWQDLSAIALRITGEKLPVCALWTKAEGDKAKTLWKERVAKSPLLTVDLGVDAKNVDNACRAKADASDDLRVALLWPEIIAKIAAAGPVDDSKPIDQKLIIQARDAVLAAPPKNPLFKQLAKVEAMQVSLDAKRAEAQVAKESVKKAQADAGGEQSSALRSTKESIAALEKAVDELKTIAELAAPSNDFAKDALLDLKGESLTAFFKAIKDAEPGKEPPTGGGKVATALILFANFSDKNNTRIAAAEKVGMESLALQEQLTKLEGQRVKRAIALMEQGVKLEQARFDAMVAQLDAHIKADSFVQGFKYDIAADARTSQLTIDTLTLQSALLGKASVECPKCKGKTPMVVEVPPEMRNQLYQGVAGYLNTAVTYQPLRYRLEAQEVALSQSGRMDAAEVNVQTWNAVLSSNVQQLKTWAEFGISKDDFQKGLNNLFTGLIAVGVLK